MVDLKPGVLDALDQADLVVKIVDAAGARAAIDGVRGRPAEEIELSCPLQREDALVLEQDEALLSDLKCDRFRLGGQLVRELGGRGTGADQAQQRGHGTGADEVGRQQNDQQRGQPALGADQLFLGFGELFYRDRHRDGGDERDGDGDKVGGQSLQYADQIFHLKGNHGFSPLCFESWQFLGPMVPLPSI